MPNLKIGFRPERISFEPREEKCLKIPGTVLTKEQLGAELNYSVDTAHGKIMVKTEEDVDLGSCVLHISPSMIFAFDEDDNRTDITEAILSPVLS